MHGFPTISVSTTSSCHSCPSGERSSSTFSDTVGSDRSDTAEYSPEEHGSQLAAVLDELGVTRAVVVGHDVSGPDAVAFTVADPERVAQLVLLNTIFGQLLALKLH
jgi:pimeloyl-ACP methyl ester carboxylesterase